VNAVGGLVARDLSSHGGSRVKFPSDIFRQPNFMIDPKFIDLVP
jgi:hypothetical protein